MIYNLTFNFYNVNITPFKEKDFYLLINYIVKSRLGQSMTYSCPASISFDSEDTKHKYPQITELDAFKRKNTNCIVFDLNENYMNKGYFDKLFVYYNEYNKSFSYGYMLYNSKTGKMSHKYLIYGDINDLFKALNESFNRLYNKDLYDYYINKHRIIQNKGETSSFYFEYIRIKDEMKNKF